MSLRSPQYYEIYKFREVIGISIIFMTVDMLGGVFNLLSLIFKTEIDALAAISYSLVAVSVTFSTSHFKSHTRNFTGPGRHRYFTLLRLKPNRSAAAAALSSRTAGGRCSRSRRREHRDRRRHSRQRRHNASAVTSIRTRRRKAGVPIESGDPGEIWVISGHNGDDESETMKWHYDPTV
jgi:hypothetical protein